MGINYFNCDHCGEVTHDHAENKEFYIEGWKDYVVCSNCIEPVQEMLVMKAPLDYWCFAEHLETKKRDTFRHIADLKEWIIGKNESDYKFGVWRSGSWEEFHRLAFVGEGRCGGMTYEETKEVANKVLTSFDCKVEIGWRGHEIEKGVWSKKTCSALVLYITSPEQFMESILIYEKQNKLEGVPFLVVSSYGPILDQTQSDLERFCFPERSSKIKWADSKIKTLEKMLSDPSTAKNQDDIDWVPTEDFVEYQRDKVDEKIEKLQKKRQRIDELEEAVHKRHKLEESDSEDNEDVLDTTKSVYKDNVEEDASEVDPTDLLIN